MVLEGCGDATILFVSNGADCDAIQTASANTSSSIDYFHQIRNLKIDGNKDNNASGDGIKFYCYSGRIESVTIWEPKDNGIVIAGTAEEAQAIDNTLHSVKVIYAGGIGIYLQGSYGGDTKISQCDVWGCGSCGITSSSGNPTISNSAIYSNTSANILISNASFGEVTGCQIGGGVLDGILIYSGVANSASYITITGNHFVISASKRSGIALVGQAGFPVQYCSVTGNTFYANSALTDSAIYLSITSNNTIMGNTLNNTAGWEEAGIQDAGSNASNVIQGNTGYIAPGEIRTASGALTAGNANAFAFTWQNPEAQAVWAEVMVDVTTAGGTAGSLLDVGSAANATTTSDNMIDGAGLNATDTHISVARVKLDANGGATDYITGQILVANAASLVGRYYIKYTGV